jgi:hypothetical protein
MAQGGFAERVAFHRDQADYFLMTARRRHLRAARLARQALQAERNGRPLRARRLMQAALRVKAAAGRAGLRSRNHRARVAALRQARTATRATAFLPREHKF